jgi:hypothetical protein
MTVAENFKVLIYSPFKGITISEVENVVIETADGQIELLSGHTNLASYLILGICRIFLKGDELIYDLFKTSIYFDSENDQLNLFCLNFRKAEEVVFDFNKILEGFEKKETDNGEEIFKSEFKLQFLDDLKIALDKKNMDNLENEYSKSES